MSPERFTAMGVEVVVGGARADELEDVRGMFALWDRTFSPFLTDSELAHVNTRETRLVAVSPLFSRVLDVALETARLTDGLVDPTFGSPAGDWTTLRLTGPLLGRRPGTTLDLNGVVKGLAADAALELVSGPAFVSAGGDVASRGVAVVGLPGGGSRRLEDGGLATSGTTHWEDHLIDPRTGHTSTSRWTEVTVAAASCLAADVAAKAAFLLSDEGPAWLDARGLAGRFREGERIVTNRVWRHAMESRLAA